MPDSNEDYVIRSGGAGDAAVIARHRASMFLDMGSVSPEESELLREASEPWFFRLLTNGDYLAWLIEHRGVIVAGGGIFVSEAGPAPGRYRLGRLGHVANVYTEPAHRRRGLARRLMETMLHWCANNGIDFVTLGASEEGKPLYESLGFKPASSMMLTLSGNG
jgi:GNAT superfamily N-acetyltransferase